jgi:hypothetical protein
MFYFFKFVVKNCNRSINKKFQTLFFFQTLLLLCRKVGGWEKYIILHLQYTVGIFFLILIICIITIIIIIAI